MTSLAITGRAGHLAGAPDFQLFVITLLLGLLFAYTLNPLVVWLEQIRIPRALGTTVVMMGVVCALSLGAYSLRGQFQTILDQVPAAVSKLSAGLASVRKGQTSTLQKVQTRPVLTRRLDGRRRASSSTRPASNSATFCGPTPSAPWGWSARRRWSSS